MKTTVQSLIAAIFVAVSLQTHAQGTLVYDQQSATGPVDVVGNGNADGLYIQEDSPLMQSFIPSLSAIGFIQLEFEDVPDNGTNGATVYVNLWTGSTLTNTATFLASTTPVYMPNGFNNNNIVVAGVTNFYFSTPVTLTPGQTYYLQPMVLSGDNPWAIVTIGDTYPNGQLYGSTGGYFQPSTDLWFREGVVSVPEPSTLALVGLGCLLAFVRNSIMHLPRDHAGEHSMLWRSAPKHERSLSALHVPLDQSKLDANPPFQQVFPGSFQLSYGVFESFHQLFFDAAIFSARLTQVKSRQIGQIV